MPANDHQPGGEHYGLKQYQHWDVVKEFNLDYMQGQITKYVFRHKSKNGEEDLRKAIHYLEKYIEQEYPVGHDSIEGGATSAYVNQD